MLVHTQRRFSVIHCPFSLWVYGTPFFLFLSYTHMNTAFMAHYNAPRMYLELRNNTLPRFRTVVTASYAGAILLMASVMLAGFGTFGKGCASMILNNYAASDGLMSLSKMAVTLSLLFTFPLAFLGVREGVMDLFSIPPSRRTQTSDYLTVGLLILVTAVAMVLKDIRHILSLGGATWVRRSCCSSLLYCCGMVICKGMSRSLQRTNMSFLLSTCYIHTGKLCHLYLPGTHGSQGCQEVSSITIFGPHRHHEWDYRPHSGYCGNHSCYSGHEVVD
jgi:hypothetical protein